MRRIVTISTLVEDALVTAPAIGENQTEARFKNHEVISTTAETYCHSFHAVVDPNARDGKLYHPVKADAQCRLTCVRGHYSAADTGCSDAVKTSALKPLRRSQLQPPARPESLPLQLLTVLHAPRSISGDPGKFSCFLW